MVIPLPPASLHSAFAGGLGRLLLSCPAPDAAAAARKKHASAEVQIHARVRITNPPRRIFTIDDLQRFHSATLAGKCQARGGMAANAGLFFVRNPDAIGEISEPAGRRL